MADDAPSRRAAPARPREIPTLGHVLQWRALHQAEQVAFVFLVDGEDEERSLTSAQLDREAIQLNAELDRIRKEVAAKTSRNQKLREQLAAAKSGKVRPNRRNRLQGI